ncbi:hypothetical protein AB6A23_05270 [Paenibacillus tarimensis]
MIIDTIDNVYHQRIVLEAAPERSKDLFQEHVVKPLLARMTAGYGTPDPMQLIGVYDSSKDASDLEALERHRQT